MTTETGCDSFTYAKHELPTVTTEPALYSDHKEADTRIIAHAVHASRSSSSVLISSIDIDVAMLLIAHSDKFECELVGLVTGVKDHKRTLNVKYIAISLGTDITSA